MATAKQVFKTIKKVVWYIFCGIFGFVFVVTAWLFVDKFIMKSPVPSFFGYSTLTIETGSMSGTMEIGDVIIIKDTGDYKIGDIITFMPDGAIIPTTHRIINYTESGEFVTKGDANNIKDTDTAEKSQILGEVVLHLPKLGQFVSWIRAEGWVYILSTLSIIALGVFVLKSSQEEELETENGAPNPSKLSTENQMENNGDSPENKA